MKKGIFGILFTLCMVLCLVPARVFAEGETTKEVETEQELADALADSTEDVITLKNDIRVSTTLNVDRTVTLDIYGYMLEMSGSGGVFVVKNGGHLTLKACGSGTPAAQRLSTAALSTAAMPKAKTETAAVCMWITAAVSP